MKIYPIDMICTKVSGCIIIKGPACPLPSLLQTAHITVVYHLSSSVALAAKSWKSQLMGRLKRLENITTCKYFL